MIAASIVGRVASYLHAASVSTMGGWTEADLYNYLNLSLRRACREVAFQATTISISVIAGATVLSLPNARESVIDMNWNKQFLLPCTVSDLDALDDLWQVATGVEPSRYVLEQQGTKIFRIYPSPSVDGTLEVVYRARPLIEQTNATTLVINQAVDMMAELEAVALANNKGGQYAMSESADGANRLIELISTVSKAYYGGAV